MHPGYGFLSENAALAEACESAGRIFIGPTPQQLRTFGLRLTARALAKAEDMHCWKAANYSSMSPRSAASPVQPVIW
nr:biotin carboxylase N-terminal domain-containing protein [Pantoea sp. PNA 03-3]